MPAFTRSADFALDKPAGTPCPNLQADLRCGIHAQLRSRGFVGCTVFDCFGAGQRVTAAFGDAWRDDGAGPADLQPTAFSVARLLSEALWHLVEARERTAPGALHDEVVALHAAVDALLAAPAELADVDAAGMRADVGAVLGRVSTAVRGPGRAAPRGDLVGRDLRGRDLSDADLRGALLLGSDLRGTRLVRTDLLGADLRAADVRGADLGDALFLTGPQLAAARGDATTVLPAWARHPNTWS